MKRLVAVVSVALCLAGCERELRRLNAAPSPASGAGSAQIGSLHAGPAASAASAATSAQPRASNAVTEPAPTAWMRPATLNPHEENAYAVSQGKRLFRWYNCNGCHSNGGGGMGPSLMDDRWLYGHAAKDVVDTILLGRPNGMPSFAGRMPEDHAWQIAAYVRSMSGLLRSDVATSRSDSLSAGPPETRREAATPKQASPP
jgi:cytochrome c oxidase cbb3-type subunit III